MFETADVMYLLPHYRFSVYALGLLLGYSLQKHKNMKLNDWQLRLGWFAAFICLLTTAWICILNQNHNSFRDALFVSIAPITLNMFFSWTIFTAHLGYKSKIFEHLENRIFIHVFLDGFVKALECDVFKIFTNLSYSIYLVQFLVFHYNNGITRSSSHFTLYRSLVLNCKLMFELKTILFFSFFSV